MKNTTLRAFVINPHTRGGRILGRVQALQHAIIETTDHQKCARGGEKRGRMKQYSCEVKHFLKLIVTISIKRLNQRNELGCHDRSSRVI